MELTAINEGLLVIATEEMYQGLAGVIEEVRRDKEAFETENGTDYEIVVNFIETPDMDLSHPELGGTGGEYVLLGEEDLIYFPNGFQADGETLEGERHSFEDAIDPSPGYSDSVRQSIG